MSAYKQFFTKALKKFGIKSIYDITPAKKKEFFNYIDKYWKGKNENMYEICMTIHKNNWLFHE